MLMLQKKELLSDAVQTQSKKRKLATMSPSFKRCTTTIEKKAFELSTLCDTPVCVVIYGPHDHVPSCVWPTDPRQLHHTLNRYLDHATKPVEDCKKKVEGGLVLKGATVDNTQVEFGVIDSLSGEQLVELGNRLESKIAAVNAKIDAIKRGQNTNTTVLDFDQNVDYCCGAVEELQMPPTTIDDFSDLFGDELWDVGMIPPMGTCPSSTSELESVQRCREQTNMMTATTSTTTTDLIPDTNNFEFDRFLEELQRGDLDMMMAEFDNVHYCGEQQIQINDENVNVGDYGCCELMVKLNSTDGFDFVTIPDEWSILDSQFPVQAQQFDAGLHQFQNEIVNLMM